MWVALGTGTGTQALDVMLRAWSTATASMQIWNSSGSGLSDTLGNQKSLLTPSMWQIVLICDPT